jgi:CRISPR-associated exonuclease Cas4
MSEIIDECLRKALMREVEKPRQGWYYPSLLPSCLLRQFWIYREGHVVSLEKSGIFKIGELFHDFLTEALKMSEDLKVETEKPIMLAIKYNDRWIRLSGRIDAVLDLNGEKFIVEVKSIGRRPNEPLDHHVMQIQPYMLALGTEKAVVVYLDKTDLTWCVFEVYFNPDLLEKMIERTITLDKALMENKAPTAEPSWECKYCEFWERCNQKKGEKYEGCGGC